MAITVPNLGLVVWNAPTDPYVSAQLADNFYRIDEHDHAPGRGRPLSSDSLADYSVTAIKIANNAVIERTHATGGVSTRALADAAVTEDKHAADSVGTSALIDAAVTTSKLDDGSVTAGKVAPFAILIGGTLAERPSPSSVVAGTFHVADTIIPETSAPAVSLAYSNGTTWIELTAPYDDPAP